MLVESSCKADTWEDRRASGQQLAPNRPNSSNMQVNVVSLAEVGALIQSMYIDINSYNAYAV